MRAPGRAIVPVVTLAALVCVTGCGSGGGGHHGTTAAPTATPRASATPIQPTPTAMSSNVQPIAVDLGPTGDYTNGLFTSVTICMPGDDSRCQTIGGVLVDTGSVGLRILSSALSLSLPQQTTASGDPAAECVPFLDSLTWGSVRVADVELAGETASAIPIQVIGDPRFPNIPARCTSSGLPPADTVGTLRTNGILGVGVFREDCGPICESTGAENPGVYYACPASGCEQIAQPIASQLQNPVWKLPEDNDGVVIELPSIPASGSDGVSGSLILGIGTQSNNGLGAANIVTLSANGTFTTLFESQSVTVSFIDSGSNGIFFLNTAQTGLPICSGNKGFYCPPSPQTIATTLRGARGETVSATFTAANANALFDGNPNAVAFDDVAGPSPGIFDFGLSFFYGRRVFAAIEGQTTPAGAGPYVAY